jgi:hypothetical protein
MPTKKMPAPQEIYQINVTLLGTRPPIWRRLLVPVELTLEQLHNVLQLAMGWDDDHLHEFRIGQRRFGRPNPDERLMGMPEVSNERTAKLSTVLGRIGAKAMYTYDFGDDWEHSILLEKRLPADPSMPYPVCTGGQRAGPPEDCGGIGGFYDLLDAMSDPNHPRHEEMRDWIGDDFDPEAFAVDEVNRKLAFLQRRRGKAPKS